MKVKENYLGISEKDIQLIERILENYGSITNPLDFIQVMNDQIDNIKPNHFLVLGYLIGEKVATYDSDQKIKQITQLCQRVN